MSAGSAGASGLAVEPVEQHQESLDLVRQEEVLLSVGPVSSSGHHEGSSPGPPDPDRDHQLLARSSARLAQRGDRQSAAVGTRARRSSTARGRRTSRATAAGCPARGTGHRHREPARPRSPPSAPEGPAVAPPFSSRTASPLSMVTGAAARTRPGQRLYRQFGPDGPMRRPVRSTGFPVFRGGPGGARLDSGHIQEEMHREPIPPRASRGAGDPAGRSPCSARPVPPPRSPRLPHHRPAPPPR